MHALWVASLGVALVSDAGLCAAFDRADDPAVRSRCLAEMARRGGQVVVSFLERKHVKLGNGPVERTRRPVVAAFLAGECPEPPVRPRPMNGFPRLPECTVEVLTALRRAGREADPLPVVVAADELETIFPNLPAVDAALVNRDPHEFPVRFTEGGDYRSGRQDRWRFDVRDARGRVVPMKTHWGYIEGSGLFGRGVLKPGESWQTTLAMRSYADLPPGDYTVAVEYHDRECIARFETTDGLVVCRSERFRLHVQPRVIDLTAADRAAARAAVAAVTGADPVRVLGGRYGAGDHDFIRPDSPAGRVLALGWRAVPALLDAAADGKATPARRAWLFVLLYSVTSWNDPRAAAGQVLADYESRGGGWVVTGGRGGAGFVMGAGSGGHSWVTGGKYDPAAQDALAREWRAFRDTIVVRDRP